jgi:hypothetical protein
MYFLGGDFSHYTLQLLLTYLTRNVLAPHPERSERAKVSLPSRTAVALLAARTVRNLV